MMKNIFLIALVVCLVSCGSSKKTAVVSNPVPTGLPALPESNINVPVKVVMKSFLDKASILIPQQVMNDDWPNFTRTACDFRYKYRFVPGGFTFNCVNNQITVKLSGTYQVAGEKCVCAFGQPSTPWIGGGCGFDNEPMRKTDILIGSALSLQPNYTVRTKTVAQKVTAYEKCTVTMFKMDITQQVMDSIKAATNVFCYSLDSVVSGFDFSSTTKSLADKINKKIPLGRYGYLKINPSAVKMSRMNYISDTLQAVMGINCFPELHSDSTNNFSAAFLPPLQSADVRSGITVYTNARYDYAFISSLINQMAKDTSFEVEGMKVILKNVKVTGGEAGRINIDVDFEGDKKGTLNLTGIPKLDTAQQLITIPDLNYSLQSKDLLLNVGKTLFGNKILRTLREKATIKIQELVEANRKNIDAQLNKKIMEGVVSTGTLTDLRVLALIVGKDALQAQTCARAKASIIITQLD